MVAERGEYLLGHSAERRRAPRRDLLTDLVQAEVDGARPLGAPLARMEGRIALDRLLDRFPDLSADPENPPRFMRSFDINGVDELRVRV
ncbi:hypothetical protein [Saccharopolyspora tripterygii]